MMCPFLRTQSNMNRIDSLDGSWADWRLADLARCEISSGAGDIVGGGAGRGLWWRLYVVLYGWPFDNGYGCRLSGWGECGLLCYWFVVTQLRRGKKRGNWESWFPWGWKCWTCQREVTMVHSSQNMTYGIYKLRHTL